ncbi:N-Lysine Methyltransferase Smyd2 [Manis pentadactyla]|nr:N-Lysine Methyltransferase Smyd2 [Manis pentadactyla]
MNYTLLKGVDYRNGMVVEEIEFWCILKVECSEFVCRAERGMSSKYCLLCVRLAAQYKMRFGKTIKHSVLSIRKTWDGGIGWKIVCSLPENCQEPPKDWKCLEWIHAKTLSNNFRHLDA